MKDMKNNMDVVQSINPAVHTSTVNGVGVDLLGFQGALVIFNTGAIDTGDANETYTPKVQESDDNSNWTDVVAADLEGTLVAITANSVQRVGYKGKKRYIRPVDELGGTTPSLTGGASVVRGHPNIAPVG